MNNTDFFGNKITPLINKLKNEINDYENNKKTLNRIVDLCTKQSTPEYTKEVIILINQFLDKNKKDKNVLDITPNVLEALQHIAQAQPKKN